MKNWNFDERKHVLRYRGKGRPVAPAPIVSPELPPVVIERQPLEVFLFLEPKKEPRAKVRKAKRRARRLQPKPPARQQRAPHLKGDKLTAARQMFYEKRWPTDTIARLLKVSEAAVYNSLNTEAA